MPRIENTTHAPFSVDGIGRETRVDEAGNRKITKEGATLSWGSGDPQVQKRLGVNTSIVTVDAATWKAAKAMPAIASAINTGDLRELGG